jgi:hypothetical protein
LASGDKKKLGEGIDAAQVALFEVVGRIEILYLPGDPSPVVGSVEMGNRADPRFSGNQGPPERLEIVADRGDNPHPGDDHTSSPHPTIRFQELSF